jgi:antitoxin CcdA
MGKVELKLEIDADLLAKARENGVDLEAAMEDAIRAAVQPTTAGNDRAQRWAEENAEAISSYNQRIATRGLFGDEFQPR